MMKSFKLTSFLQTLFLLGFCTLLFSGCLNFNCKRGNGKVVKQNRKVTGFNAIDISGSYEVILIQGNTTSLIVEADDNLQSVIKTKVENKKLIVENEESICDSKSLKLYITTPDIKSVSLSGVVDLKNVDTIRTKMLAIDVSGVADIHFAISVEKLSLSCSGSGTIALKGRAGDMDAEISGSGEINAFGLLTDTCSLSSSGAGKANLNVSQKLDVDISGTATVKYKGNPKVKQDISGVGSFEKVE